LDSGADSFTVSFPFNGHLKEALSVCGIKSGRDIDKGTVVNFIPAKSVASPIVEGCGLYYECRINLSQQVNGINLPQDIIRQFYKDDFHFMYFGEIVECY
jgi:flavin reductase (DIM6/NTAB) family NADH-FMN oxidoreductase RutF